MSRVPAIRWWRRWRWHLAPGSRCRRRRCSPTSRPAFPWASPAPRQSAARNCSACCIWRIWWRPTARSPRATRRCSVTAGWHAQGLRVGFANGCFDLIHPGHVRLLTEARAHCDRLVVALNTDASVQRLKGPTRPLQSESSRATVMASLAPVDMVVLFDEETPFELIQALRPDVLVKGADYSIDQVVGADLVQGWGGTVLLVELQAGHSTTGTIRRMTRPRPGVEFRRRPGSPIHHEPQDRVHHRLRLVAADRVAAALEHPKVRPRDQPRDLLGELRRTDPVVPARQHQRRRGDPPQLAPQVEPPQEARPARTPGSTAPANGSSAPDPPPPAAAIIRPRIHRPHHRIVVPHLLSRAERARPQLLAHLPLLVACRARARSPGRAG